MLPRVADGPTELYTKSLFRGLYAQSKLEAWFRAYGRLSRGFGEVRVFRNNRGSFTSFRMTVHRGSGRLVGSSAVSPLWAPKSSRGSFTSFRMTVLWGGGRVGRQPGSDACSTGLCAGCFPVSKASPHPTDEDLSAGTPARGHPVRKSGCGFSSVAGTPGPLDFQTARRRGSRWSGRLA